MPCLLRCIIDQLYRTAQPPRVVECSYVSCSGVDWRGNAPVASPCLINPSFSPTPRTYRLDHDVEMRIALALQQEEQHKEQARTEEGDEGGWSWSMLHDEEGLVRWVLVSWSLKNVPAPRAPVKWR